MRGAVAAFDAMAWFGATPDPVTFIGLDGRVLFVKDAAAAVLGHSRETCVGRTHRELDLSPAVCEAWERAIARAATGEHPAFEFRVVVDARDGGSREGGGGECVHHVRLSPYGTGGHVAGMIAFGRDVTPIVRSAERDLDDVRRRMAALMDAAPVGISFSDDATCERISGNRTVAEQFDWNPDANMSASAPEPDAPGRQIQFLRHGIPMPAEELPLQRAVAENRFIAPIEFEVVLPSGRRWVCESTAAPIRDAHGNAIRGVAVTVDITARKRAERELIDAHRRLSDADRRKDEFLAVLSHELRNPLTPILNALLVLDRVELTSDRAQNALGVIRRQAKHIARLVDDLLDVNRIANSKVQVRREPTDLAAVTRQIVGDTTETCRQRGLDVEIRLPDEVLWVDADPTRLAQAIGNLLHNAAKFTPQGGHIRVTVSASASGAAVEVTDDGLGIETSLLEQVFHPFAQAQRTQSYSRGGLGLGLALVRGIVELHGGAVTAASDGPGRGSTFRIELPTCDPPRKNVARPADPSRGRALRVLVIDDSKDAADSLRFLLESFGHSVDVAYTGADGVNRARKARPDVVICDIGLPDLDGYEVGRRICTECGPKPLLIALTGFGMKDDQHKAAQAGFDRHFTKPADLEAIRSLLDGSAGPLGRER